MVDAYAASCVRLGLSSAVSDTQHACTTAATAWAALAVDEAQLDAAAARAMVGLLPSQLTSGWYAQGVGFCLGHVKVLTKLPSARVCFLS